MFVSGKKYFIYNGPKMFIINFHKLFSALKHSNIENEMSTSRKRKFEEETKGFRRERTDTYAFVQNIMRQPKCLICD
jgi:hypothetical protein